MSQIPISQKVKFVHLAAGVVPGFSVCQNAEVALQNAPAAPAERNCRATRRGSRSEE